MLSLIWLVVQMYVFLLYTIFTMCHLFIELPYIINIKTIV